MHNSVILAGASVRSLAESAVMCGLRPICVDLFGDADLRLRLSEFGCPAPVLLGEFEQLPDVVRTLPIDAPLIWTGGLENSPQILQQIAEQRTVCGIRADRLAGLRTPEALRSLLDGGRCRIPAWTNRGREGACRAAGQTWLVKSLAGSGGQGIRRYDSDGPIGPSEYLQQYVSGIPLSAVYCSDGQATRLLGASLQISGDDTLGSQGFAFCGNVGPVRPAAAVQKSLLEAGHRVGAAGMSGVFGIDFVAGEDGLWLIEVNPRVTASHEMYDFAAGRTSVLQRHLKPRSEIREALAQPLTYRSASQMLARQIVYVVRDTVMKESDVHRLCEFRRDFQSSVSPEHWMADIPVSGRLSAGQPFCSVYHVLHRDRSGWTTRAVDGFRTRGLGLVSQIAGISELDTVATAIHHASLFERSAASDNGEMAAESASWSS